MLNPEDILVVVDQVEDDEFDGKPYKRIITFTGESFKIGKKLEHKWDLLVHGVCLKLIMAVWQGNTYVKDYDRCLDITEGKMKELMQPAPKNPKDVSIERQTAVKCVCEMLAAGAEVPEDIKEYTLEWLRNALK